MTAQRRIAGSKAAQLSSVTPSTKTTSESEVFRPPARAFRPKCREHGPPAIMDEAVLVVRFPRGQLPVRGFRCPTCEEEIILGSDVEKIDEIARGLGLFGVEQTGKRKLIRAGNSLAVTLDPELVADVLHGAKAGSTVRVGRIGKRIFVEPL